MFQDVRGQNSTSDLDLSYARNERRAEIGKKLEKLWVSLNGLRLFLLWIKHRQMTVVCWYDWELTAVNWMGFYYDNHMVFILRSKKVHGHWDSVKIKRALIRKTKTHWTLINLPTDFFTEACAKKCRKSTHQLQSNVSYIY